MGRIVGIDYGQARIGLALSDESQFLASPIKAVPTQKTLKETAQLLLKEVEPYQPVEKIVIGLPLHLSGAESPSSQAVRKLATELESLSEIPVLFWDERLTTSQVERTLKEANMSRKKRSKVVDAMAAALILQSFLDANLHT